MTAVNSINFARIAAQCGLLLHRQQLRLGKSCTFVVPTGNFGDVFAGEAAMRMGLDVARLVIATNSQRHHGPGPERWRLRARAPAHATLSPSMDIQVASNFERALFEASRARCRLDRRRHERLRARPAKLGILHRKCLSWKPCAARYSAFACR